MKKALTNEKVKYFIIQLNHRHFSVTLQNRLVVSQVVYLSDSFSKKSTAVT